MTVKQLKKLLKGMPDDMDVLIPTSMEFEGMWYSPCIGESGIEELGVDEESDETYPALVLVPHGFWDLEEEGEDFVNPELN